MCYRKLFKRGIIIITFFSFIPFLISSSNGVYVKTKEGRRACIEGDIFLRIPVSSKTDLNTLVQKYTGDRKNLQTIMKYNPQVSKKKNYEVRIPLTLLLPEFAIETISALFPNDFRTEKGWMHKYSNESFETLARMFCGSSKKANLLKKELTLPKKGEFILIPNNFLSKPFKYIPIKKDAVSNSNVVTSKDSTFPTPKEEKSSPQIKELSVEEARKLLSYGKDDKGEYAIYKLAQGEALYSAVVVRFTGRIFANEVNSLALEIAKRSKIEDVTSIPIGYEIKIPLEMLLPQFYPEDSDVYKKWVEHQNELSNILLTYKNSSLEGVVVIIDPGHGGLDRGAIKNKVWEDSYAYDIACRIREALETKTKAKVFMTLIEPSKGFKPIDKPYLAPNKNATILTHPPFKPDSSEETKAAVNLRWILANNLYLNLKKEGLSPEKIVFVSIHADSLHPSLRGSMFYIPGTSYRESKWSIRGQFYMNFSEAKSSDFISLTPNELKKSEALSLRLATFLKKSFEKNGLKLHPYQAIRDHVVRNKKAWVPAVLKYNLIPCSILIEVCNLNNVEDAELIKDPIFRQKIANAFIEAIIMYYS